MINKKNITKIFYLFLSLHLILWTTIPSVSNVNLPLDTIEALAWGSDLDWGYSKHPPFSAFAVEIFYFIFGSQDWAYYLLSQIFVIISFIYVWKLSLEIFQEKIFFSGKSSRNDCADCRRGVKGLPIANGLRFVLAMSSTSPLNILKTIEDGRLLRPPLASTDHKRYTFRLYC